MKRALLLVVALAGCQAAMERILHPPALAATWIGLSADGLTWYRLDLDDEGTGMCATTKGSEMALYRVRRWSDEGEMTIHLEIADGKDAHRSLSFGLRISSRANRLRRHIAQSRT